MKADPAYTYLQCGFSSQDCATTSSACFASAMAEEFLFHIEFMKNGDGVVIPGAIPVCASPPKSD